MVGYREIVEAHGKARGLNGFVFNDVDGSVKIMASGLEDVISEFIRDLKINRPETTIETMEIVEDIGLPSPFSRIATDDIREYMARFDRGIVILGEHSKILKEHTSLLYGINDKLGMLEVMNENLAGTNNKLDTLPERIAVALKR